MSAIRRCEYRDSKMVSGPTATAANQGTTITVEDLFYNIPTRRAALRSASEEHNKIAEVVTKYAIHNAGVGFVLKKQGESGVDVRTSHANTVVDNIKTVYGPSVAKELIEFSIEDDKYKFKSKGHISNVNYSVKKMIFLLFINNRLVDCTPLKRAIEHVYASYLPKGSSPFVYMSLNIAPHNLDVNVHPTKHEVFFLHQDAIIEKIQQGLEDKLLNSNSSRAFNCNKLLPGAGITLEMFDNKQKSVAPKDMVRTDANIQKIDKFFNASMPTKTSDNDKESPKKLEPEYMNDLSRKTDLTSVDDIKEDILHSCSPEVRDVLASHTFVGCVDRELALFQHDTKLFLANTTTLSSLLFRQIIFSRFGELPVLRLCPPPRVRDLALIALEDEASGWTPEEGTKAELAGQVEKVLGLHKDMLADYFSLEMEDIEDELHLTGLPLLLEDFCPWFGGLPRYLSRLAAEVEWATEKECFEGVAKETAAFYSVREVAGRSPRYDTGQHGGAAEAGDWRRAVEHLVYPAIKRLLLPPTSCLNDRTIVQVANLPDLYKVFERC